MNDFHLGEVMSNMVGGILSTVAVWLASAVWQVKKDLDAAHRKLRDIELKLKEK